MGASRNKRSVDAARFVAAVLVRHVRPAQRLSVALSGGVDSVALLHLLQDMQQRFAFELSAIHVNHQISPNASRWADFCAALCADWGIPLVLRRVRVANDLGAGLEAAARSARYREFAALDADWIVLGHHQDDQAETVLLNLLRGSGVRGVAAMPEVRDLDREGRRRLLRPLLGVARPHLEHYARIRGLAWIEDESNRDVEHRRNFLRHEVLPLIERRFPGCREALARSAGLAAESALLLDALGAADALHCVDTGGRLNLAAVRLLAPERAKNLLRHWLRDRGLRMPSSARLETAWEQLCGAVSETRIRIDLEGGAIRCYRGWASIEPVVSPAGCASVSWRGEAELGWGQGSVIFRRTIGEGLSIEALARNAPQLRTRRGGERMQVDWRRPHRTLKNLCQEAGIPPWLRPAMPLLWCGDDLVWIPGVGVAAGYRCAGAEPGLLPAWQREIPG